jgi:hypothetical protein
MDAYIDASLSSVLNFRTFDCSPGQTHPQAHVHVPIVNTYHPFTRTQSNRQPMTPYMQSSVRVTVEFHHADEKHSDAATVQSDHATTDIHANCDNAAVHMLNTHRRNSSMKRVSIKSADNQLCVPVLDHEPTVLATDSDDSDESTTEDAHVPLEPMAKSKSNDHIITLKKHSG